MGDKELNESRLFEGENRGLVPCQVLVPGGPDMSGSSEGTAGRSGSRSLPTAMRGVPRALGTVVSCDRTDADGSMRGGHSEPLSATSPVSGEFVISMVVCLHPPEQPEQRGMPPQASLIQESLWGVQVTSFPPELCGLAFFLPDHTFQK